MEFDPLGDMRRDWALETRRRGDVTTRYSPDRSRNSKRGS